MSENKSFFDVFRGYRYGTLGQNGLMKDFSKVTGSLF